MYQAWKCRWFTDANAHRLLNPTWKPLLEPQNVQFSWGKAKPQMKQTPSTAGGKTFTSLLNRDSSSHHGKNCWLSATVRTLFNRSTSCLGPLVKWIPSFSGIPRNSQLFPALKSMNAQETWEVLGIPRNSQLFPTSESAVWHTSQKNLGIPRNSQLFASTARQRGKSSLSAWLPKRYIMHDYFAKAMQWTWVANKKRIWPIIKFVSVLDNKSITW